MWHLLVTHIDLDGVGCLIMGKYFQYPYSAVLMLDYKELYTETGELALPDGFDECTVTDISVDRKMYEELKRKYRTVRVFDHHEPTGEIAGEPGVVWDTGRSGTKLFFDHLRAGKRVPAVVEDFARLVDVRDRYVQDHPLWEKASNLDRVLWKTLNWGRKGEEKYSYFIAQQLEKFSSGANEIVFSNAEHIYIQEAIERECKAVVEARNVLQKRIDERGVEFGVIWGRAKISHMCNEILKENEGMQYIYCVSTYCEGSYDHKISGKISVRSKPGFNINTLGPFEGHEQAGAAELSAEDAKRFLEGKISAFPYAEETVSA